MFQICTQGARLRQAECARQVLFCSASVADSLGDVRPPLQRAVRFFLGKRLLRREMNHSTMAKALGASRQKLIQYLKGEIQGFVELRHLDNFAVASGMSIAGMFHELEDIAKDLHPSIIAAEETAMAPSDPGRPKQPKKTSRPGDDDRTRAAEAERERVKGKKPSRPDPRATP